MATKKMTSKKAEKAEKAEKVEKTVKAEKKAKTAVKAAAALKKVKAAKSAKSAKPAPADQAYVPAPEVAAILPDLIALRHELHQHPERGFDTAGTRMRVAKWLSDHGVTAIENETLESALFVTVEGNHDRASRRHGRAPDDGCVRHPLRFADPGVRPHLRA